MDGGSTSGLTTAPFSFEVCTETVDDGVAAFFLEATHVYGSSLHREMCGWRLNLWVDDSALHSFEVCTETVDDGVTAFFLEATHVHASDFDPSVQLCCGAFRLPRGRLRDDV